MSEPKSEIIAAPASWIVKAVVIACVALISSMLGTYFIWLGTEVNAIGKTQTRMEASVNILLGAHERRAALQSDSNTDRIGALEKQ